MATPPPQYLRTGGWGDGEGEDTQRHVMSDVRGVRCGATGQRDCGVVVQGRGDDRTAHAPLNKSWVSQKLVLEQELGSLSLV